jgi:N-acetylglucosamine repressor
MTKIIMSDAKILRYLLLTEAKSRRDIAIKLEVSKATITNAVNRFLKLKIIEEGDYLQENRSGRKTISLRIKPDLAYFCGTDLEGMTIRACIIDCEKRIIKSTKIAIKHEWSEKTIVEKWFKTIENLVKNSNIPRGKIVSLGFGLPGIVYEGKKMTHAYLPNDRWNDIEIGKVFKTEFPNITVANNSMCVYEYERKLGVGRNFTDFMSILIRYGIGVTISLKNNPVISENIFTGELGHMRIDIDGEKCICGQKGCLDTFISGRTFNKASINTEEILKDELKKRGKYLGIAIANLLKIFYSNIVVLNGIYNEYENIIKPVLIKTIKNELFNLKLNVPSIIFGRESKIKTSIGATILGAERFFEKYLIEKYSIY